jgi:5-(carboxyamino)imidazole ribonucleotide synthase
MQTLGIIGGGQLARMLVLQAAALGVRCQVLDPNPDAGAGQLCQQIVADYDDIEALRALSDAVDALTYDFENVPAAALQQAKLGTKLSPGVSVLHVAQDRLKEKQLFQQLGIEVGGFHAVNSRTDLLEALDQTGYPAVLKTRRMGYDGKGQALLRQQEDLERAWQQMGGEDLILEAFITFQQEYSIIGVRNRAGEVRCYPLVQNVHEHGILRCSRVSLAQNRRGQNSLGQNWSVLISVII